MPLCVHFYNDIALCFSASHLSNLHAHQALQMTVGLDGEFGIELVGDAMDSSKCNVGFACIAPQQTHKIHGLGKSLAYLFVDTNPTAFTRWKSNGGEVVAPDETLLDELRAINAQPDTPRDAIRDLAYRWREHSLPGIVAICPSDPRVRRAIEIIDADLLSALNYAELANKVHLSPSRFANIFREQTGLPVRNYILWRRLVHVLKRLEYGDSITTAAHTAGFSDCAHLSRSFHRICGSVPSELTVT
jgi:AraC family transcriptional regulator